MNNNFVVLNTSLTKELVDEGVARELVSKVQQLRKTKDFDIVDRIKLYYDADDSFEEVLEMYKEMIMNDTLSLEIVSKKLDTEVLDLNGMEVKIDVEKIAK